VLRRPRRSPRLDGGPSDAAWTRAEPIRAFVQREPNEGAAASFRTEARVGYDDEAVYVAVRAFDAEAHRVQSYLTRRR